MLKYLLSFIIAMFSINTFADDYYSCTVPNSGGTVVSLKNTSGRTDDYGYVKIAVEFTNVQQLRQISVNITIYDAVTDKKVDVTTIKEIVSPNAKNNGQITVNLEPNHSYYFRIHHASCTK